MRIVVLDGYTVDPGDNPWDTMIVPAEWVIHEQTASDQVLERCTGAEIVLTNKIPFSAERLKQLSTLRLIVVTATGYDVVDVKAAAELGITVCNVPNYSAPSVAEHVFALTLALSRHVELHDQRVRAGERGRAQGFCFWVTPQRELAGLTMGVVGWGEIGSRVGRIAAAMDMRVVATSRSHRKVGSEVSPTWMGIEELLAQADIVSLHCPLTPQTRGLMNRRQFARMKPSAFLINTARGALVVDEDLLEALRDQRIAGAGIDTLATEPIPLDHPLLEAPNCILTPHMAWTTIEARRRLVEIAQGNIVSFLSGAPRNVVS